MVPVHTSPARSSPYFAAAPSLDGTGGVLARDGEAVARISFPRQPRFYRLPIFDRAPHPKIAAARRISRPAAARQQQAAWRSTQTRSTSAGSRRHQFSREKISTSWQLS